MRHLSGVDASFLHLETPEMPMHVGSLNIFDLPEGYSGDFYEAVKAHVAGRMHLAEVFEHKLAQIPFELSNPVWVDDNDVDLDYHIRRVVLSRPGTFRQLEQLVGRLHSSLLDRSRPLWEFYVIEGLQTGQPAIYAKVHHAAVDGQAGVALAKALYDLTPESRQVKALRARNRSNQYQLGVAELATAAVQNTVQQYVKLFTTLPNAMRAMASAAMPGFAGGRSPQFGLPKNWTLGPKTPLNVSITNQRSFAARSVPLAEVKQIAKRIEGTVNDVVLAASATALRRYLADYNKLPKEPLTAAVPVSLREAGNTDLNNQVSMILVSLATNVADPLERLKAINASSRAAKELSGSFKAAIPTDFPSFGAPWIMGGFALLFGRSRLSDTLPPIANVAISNVPGAPVPLYMAGAKLATYYPVSIPAHGVALNITVQSYNGSLDYGLTACRRAVPDVDDLIEYLMEAHRELRDLVLGPQAEVTGAVKAAAVQPQPAEPAVAARQRALADAIPAPRKRASGNVKTVKPAAKPAASPRGRKPPAPASRDAKVKGRKASTAASEAAKAQARKASKPAAAAKRKPRTKTVRKATTGATERPQGR
ncbi:MAG: wax ester/triacylglycerol synthase family O-acyltransferase [Hyphomonadaceae bacterium]|jgi:WS/DGAT/MGAT family acyltransferase|nr:wax ester/triacylglycerol synthase family O-acyltransferase [Hyphomonadaceae bacterium]